MAVGGCQGLAPIRGALFLQPLDPPGGMVPNCDRVTVGISDQCLAFPQKSTQTGIEKVGLGLGGRAAFGCFHRLVDQRKHVIWRIGVIPGQRQCHAQQRISRRWGQTGCELLAQRLGPPQIAPHVKGQGLHARAQIGGHTLYCGGARCPFAHRLHHGRRRAKLTPQGHGFNCRIHHVLKAGRRV